MSVTWRRQILGLGLGPVCCPTSRRCEPLVKAQEIKNMIHARLRRIFEEKKIVKSITVRKTSPVE